MLKHWADRSKPELAHPEQDFIDELESVGVKTGNFKLPDWGESNRVHIS